MLDLEHESESNGTSDHTSISNEYEFVELDRLLLEAASAHVECAKHAQDSSSENDRQLDEDK